MLDPKNLILNPGAECVSAEGWTGLEVLSRGEFGIRRGLGRSGEYAFYWNGQSQWVLSGWHKIDVNKTYELSGWFKSDSGAPNGVLFGLFLADAQQRPINHWNVFSVKGTGTELSASCHAGDRFLRIKDASGWKLGASYCAAFGVGENEYTQEVTSLGVEDVRREGADWLVTLERACGLNMPGGTKIVENQAGSNGIFLPGAGRGQLSNEWKEARGTIGPRQWWPGTAYARVTIIPSAGIAVLMDDFWCHEKP